MASVTPWKDPCIITGKGLLYLYTVSDRLRAIRQSVDRKEDEGRLPGKVRLLDQVHEAVRTLHYSRRTEESCVHWIRRFIFWSGKRHPATLGEAEVSAFL